jgi:hypothetical protein
MPGKRPLILAGALAVTMATGLALVACAHPGPVDDWAGGQVSAKPVQVTVNPSAMPVGDAVATGLVVRGQELIILFWSDPDHPSLGINWRDVATGRINDTGPLRSSAAFGLGRTEPDRLIRVDQLDAGDGTVIEYGAVGGSAARIVSQAPGSAPVEAKYVRWSLDPSVSFFWLRRRGAPIPSNSPSGHEGLMVPLAPERYPLFSAYDRAGRLIASVRLRPEAYGPRNDG